MLGERSDKPWTPAVDDLPQCYRELGDGIGTMLRSNEDLESEDQRGVELVGFFLDLFLLEKVHVSSSNPIFYVFGIPPNNPKPLQIVMK